MEAIALASSREDQIRAYTEMLVGCVQHSSTGENMCQIERLCGILWIYRSDDPIHPEARLNGIPATNLGK
jgi:hypothetical protein